MPSANTFKLRELTVSGATFGPDLKPVLLKLAAEIKERLTRPPSEEAIEFFAEVVTVLSRIKNAAHSDIRFNCLLDSALFFNANGYGSEAIKVTQACAALARRSDNLSWTHKSETLAGIAYGELGNPTEAIVRHANGFRIAREMDDLTAETTTLCNLGAALNYAGLYREAIPCLERAISLSQLDSVRKTTLATRGDASYFELAALANLAQSHYFVEEFQRGFQLIARCVSLSHEPTGAFTAQSRTIREFSFVLLALELKFHAAAREHAEQCCHYGALGGFRAQVLGQIAKGLCEVRGGDVQHGIRLLENALQSSGENILRTDALMALVRALSEIGNSRQALIYLKEALDSIQRQREKSAKLLIELGGEMSASPMRVSPETDDLRMLRLTQAELRAKVAEEDALTVKIETLERLSIAADLADDPTGEHGFRVGRLSYLLASDIGLPLADCAALEQAARLHDIGKIGMPDRILMKAEKVLGSERSFLNAHTSVGAEILSSSAIPQLRLAEEIARYHHEWWNGAGYPARLVGQKIPLPARIVALADVFDAVTHGRPYAAAWSIEFALKEILNRKGTQFDPRLTEAFVALITRLQASQTSLEGLLSRRDRTWPFGNARNTIRSLLDQEALVTEQ